MANKKPACNRCKKPIHGTIKVNTKQVKSGKRVFSKTFFYCEECFRKLSKENPK